MKAYPRFVLVILLANTLAALGEAKNSHLEYSADVKLVVSGEGTTRDLVQSYLGRELRSLKDVRLVESQPNYLLSVVTMDIHNKGGQKTGIVISVVALSTVDRSNVTNTLQVKDRAIGRWITENLYGFETHRIQVGAQEEMQKICAEIVALFDSEILEQNRKFVRKSNEGTK